jgi:hypothetical protein
MHILLRGNNTHIPSHKNVPKITIALINFNECHAQISDHKKPRTSIVQIRQPGQG